MTICAGVTLSQPTPPPSEMEMTLHPSCAACSRAETSTSSVVTPGQLVTRYMPMVAAGAAPTGGEHQSRSSQRQCRSATDAPVKP